MSTVVKEGLTLSRENPSDPAGWGKSHAGARAVCRQAAKDAYYVKAWRYDFTGNWPMQSRIFQSELYIVEAILLAVVQAGKTKIQQFCRFVENLNTDGLSWTNYRFEELKPEIALEWE